MMTKDFTILMISKTTTFIGVMSLTLAMQSCGRGKKVSGTETPSQPPAEVAGGFGLTCLVTNNGSNNLLVDYDCAYRDKDGNKFVDRPDLALKTVVKIGSRSVDFTAGKKEDDYNFRLTISRVETSAVIVNTIFVNPKDGGKVVLEAGQLLGDVPSWADVTLSAENKPSSCKKDPVSDKYPENCTLGFYVKNLPRIWFQKKVVTGLTYKEASDSCAKTIHNFQPNTSIGSTSWRLAKYDELKRLFVLQKQILPEERWIELEEASYWLGGRSPNDSASTKALLASTLEEVSASSQEKHAAICVLDRSTSDGIWTDITTSATGDASDCSKSPNRCTKRDEVTKLWWSATQSSAEGMTWSEAKSHCRTLSYNGQTGWRLPTKDQIKSAAINDILFFAQDSWIADAVMRKNIWSSESSTKDVDAFFGVLAWQCPVISDTCPIRRPAGTGWFEPVATKNAVVCVRPDKIYWQDMTDGSSCEDNPQNCVLKLISTNTLYSGVLTGTTSSTLKTWDDAKTLCQNYNPPGVGGQGSWTLPTMKQLLDAHGDKIKDVLGWTGGKSMETAFWSNETDGPNSNLVKTATFLNGSPGTGSATSQYQVFCIKPAQ